MTKVGGGRASNGSGKGRGSSLQGPAALGMVGRAGMVGIRLFEPGMPTFTRRAAGAGKAGCVSGARAT